MMLLGAVLMVICIGIALSGVQVANFWFALFLLGVGWNFMYTGGTTGVPKPTRGGVISPA